MCTLIVGRDVLGPGSVVIGANRDEDPARPSEPPGVLSESPRLVGGRDLVAGGTWLAIREGRAAVAVLNRHGPPADGAAGLRSRGLLALDVAGAAPSADGLAGAARRRALEAVARERYAAFSLAYLAPDACWVMTHVPGTPAALADLEAGWHALTHADLDDPGEPRTAWLRRELSGWKPRSAAEAERRLAGLLRSHGAPSRAAPPVCIHDGRMVTVSSSIVIFARTGARYRHVEGRPCERRAADRSALFAAGPRARRAEGQIH